MAESLFLVMTIRVPTENTETARTLYARLNNLIATVPDLKVSGKLTVQMDIETANLPG